MKSYFFLLVIILSFIFSESDLLRSEYLTQDMIDDIQKLDNYNKKARKIKNKYERAKFYQIVAYTYYIKYEKLVLELESLERHYYSVFNDYIENIDFNSIENKISPPGIQNQFVPILFNEETDINIKLFKAKSKMFKKQYHDYLTYFNNKINLYSNKLMELKQLKPNKNEKDNYNKTYHNYNDFLLDIEAIGDSEYVSNTLLDSNNLIHEIKWNNENNIYKRKFYYDGNSDNIIKTVDLENEKIILEINYNINLKEDEFIDFIILNDIGNLSLIDYGNYCVIDYNEFEQPIKTTYYSVNRNIIGRIVKNFEQDLELINESWYIGSMIKK